MRVWERGSVRGNEYYIETVLLSFSLSFFDVIHVYIYNSNNKKLTRSSCFSACSPNSGSHAWSSSGNGGAGGYQSGL